MRFTYLSIPAALFVLNWSAIALAAPVVDLTAVPHNNHYQNKNNNHPAKRAPGPLPPSRFPGSAEEDFAHGVSTARGLAYTSDSLPANDEYMKRSKIIPASMPLIGSDPTIPIRRSKVVPASAPFVGSDSTIPIRRSKVVSPSTPFIGSDATVPVRKSKLPPSTPFIGSDPTIPNRRRDTSPSLPSALTASQGHEGMNMSPPMSLPSSSTSAPVSPVPMMKRAQPSPAPTAPVGPSPESDVPEDLKTQKNGKRFIKNADYQSQNGGSTPEAAGEAQSQPKDQREAKPEGGEKA